MNEEKQTSPGKLKLVFINGTVLNVQRRDIIVWIAEPTTGIFLGFVSAVFLIYFAYVGRQEYIPQEVWQLAVSVLVFVVFFFFVVLSTVFLSFYVLRLQPRFVLPMPLVIVVAHVLNQLVAVVLIEQWGVYVPDSAVLYLRIIKLYVCVLALEIFYSVYLLPRSGLFRDRQLLHPAAWAQNPAPDGPRPISAQSEQKEMVDTNEATELNPKSEVSAPTTFSLGGQDFDARAIRIIRAQQNYIEIETAADKALVRATIKEAVDLLDTSHGVQAHRSCWVSFASISDSKSIPNGKLLLELDNGETVIVPRARRKEVKKAIKAHAQSVALDAPVPNSASSRQG